MRVPLPAAKQTNIFFQVTVGTPVGYAFALGTARFDLTMTGIGHNIKLQDELEGTQGSGVLVGQLSFTNALDDLVDI
jgi:hypothetical protein